MTDKEYDKIPALRRSALWEFRKSPAHYKYAVENPPDETPALRFGIAVHMSILEPERFADEYITAPKIDRRTKAGKEEYQAFLESSAGKEIITAEDAETIKGIVKAFKKNRDAVQLLKGTKRERLIFRTDDNGILC